METRNETDLAPRTVQDDIDEALRSSKAWLDGAERSAGDRDTSWAEATAQARIGHAWCGYAMALMQRQMMPSMEESHEIQRQQLAMQRAVYDSMPLPEPEVSG